MLILLYAIDGEVFAARGNEWPNSLVLWFQGKRERWKRGNLLAYTALQDDGYLMAKFSCVQHWFDWRDSMPRSCL